VRNTFRLAISMFLLMNLVACDSLLDDKPPALPENQNWVIITNEHAEKMGIAAWLVESEGFWTPSADDVLNLEGKIAEYLSQNSVVFSDQPPVWERLDEYRRQYIGLERGGRQIIYGNYFCSNEDNWRQEFIMVIDGGECYFQVEYDVESGLFIRLLVNGES